MRLKLGQKGVSTSSIIQILIVLVVAGSLMTTIVATFANSTFTGLSGASATLAALAPLFIILVIFMWLTRRK